MNYIDIWRRIEKDLLDEKKVRKKDKNFTEAEQIEFVKEELRKEIKDSRDLKRFHSLNIDVEFFSGSNFLAILLAILTLLYEGVDKQYSLLKDINIQGLKDLIYPHFSLNGLVALVVVMGFLLMVIVLPLIIIITIIQWFSKFFGKHTKITKILNLAIEELIEEYEECESNKIYI